MYNAHLEVVHQGITAQEESLSNGQDRVQGEGRIEYTTFGGPGSRTVASKAEEGILKRRVGAIAMPEVCAF